MATEINNDLLLYEERLQELNLELGTSYTFPKEYSLLSNNHSLNEMIQFYSSMSIEEFDSYIRNMFEKDQLNPISITTFYEKTENTNIFSSQPSMNVEQRLYYSGANYLYIGVNIARENNYYVYLDNPNYGQRHSNYPYYDPSIGYSSSISNDGTLIYCEFDCVKYIAQYLIDTGIYTLKGTFKAGGGNLYPSTR